MTNSEQMQRFLEICIALTAEHDREALLSGILDTAMDISDCDAGTLYLLEDDVLHFCRMVTRSFGIRQGGHADPITLPPVPLNPAYVCSWAVIHNESINVKNVRTDSTFDFSGSLRYDEMTGYNTQTMLVVPLANDKDVLIGAMQLINALDENGNTVPFDPSVETLVHAIASQAAISITNMQYSEQIIGLLDSLVGALSKAIDERTPYNANHTRNMVSYGASFLDWLDREQSELRFDAIKRRTFLMSVWLHDVGKMVVPLEVMNKESRLGDGLERVQSRFAAMKLLTKIELLEGKISEQEAETRTEEIESGIAFIEKIDRAGFLPDGDLERVEQLASLTYTDENGEEKPWITGDEKVCLSVRKGTLTAQEREIMESHASVTAKILAEVDFPREYDEVPVWAAAHHELLNGKGYPHHLKAEEIPFEVRLLTILDVFEALTAKDRPYKPGMPAEKAIAILKSMVEEGSIDGEILAMFEKSKAWEVTK